MQEGRAQRRGVQAHARADLGHAHGVDDEVLAAGPALVGVAVAGEDEGLLHQLAVDGLARLARVLLDHGEQVAEHHPLVVGQARVVAGRQLGGDLAHVLVLERLRGLGHPVILGGAAGCLGVRELRV